MKDKEKIKKNLGEFVSLLTAYRPGDKLKQPTNPPSIKEQNQKWKYQNGKMVKA